MRLRKIFILSTVVLLAVACAKKKDDPPPTASLGSEKAYCSGSSAGSSPITVTATAQYRYRQVSRTVGLTSPATANIRYAEVEILDGAGNRIQCGETDGTGNISLQIPRAAGSYTLRVNSRGSNSFVQASVLNNPTAMDPYSISATFTLSGGESSVPVTLTAADYQNNIEGGAFNIFDQIVKANEYIRANSTCPSLGGICSAFSVAPKVQVFWTKGLSPGAYYGSPSASISFYIAKSEPTYGMAAGMYIMGGVNGNICVDTDHFDNSVIIHEYGHFLENAYAVSNSPGGSHNGNSVIDPRLAWSEGWSNFLQGAVRGNSRYVDTVGNTDCTSGTGVNVDLDLETITAGQDAVSGSSYLGEGIFREVSVSRALWDMIDTTTGGDSQGGNLGFGAIWKVFSDPTIGFKSSNIRFRNIGHFNEVMRSLVNTYANSSLTAFDSLILNERQRSDRREYGLELTPRSGGSCTYNLLGVANVDNYARTNDFFNYYYDGTSAHSSISLKYGPAAGGTPSDLDLYVWREDYAFNDSSTMMASSERIYPEAGGTGVETISLAGKSAGYYLIQVRADPTNTGTTAQYYLETNGGSERLCP